jgi:acyl-CoA dehydrogenase
MATDLTGNWDLPEEYKLLRETVRRFMAEDVRPEEEKLEHDANALPSDVLARLQGRARQLGLWCVQTPAEFGGAGLNLLGQCVVAEEAAKCRMGLYFPAAGSLGQDPPKVIFRGTPHQVARYGLRTVNEGLTTFVAISEAGGGSDPARSIATRAERRGDRYVVNGSKMWISYIDQADWGVLYARTGQARERGGITAFIIDPRRRGITLTRIGVMRSHQPFEVRFEDYEIPLDDRLGEEGEGFQLADEWLVHARVPYAAASIGVAQAALELAIEWAKQRQTFGQPLSDRQAIQWMLVDSETDLRAARLLTWQAAWKADRGENIKTEAAIAKVFATEAAGRVVDRCMQVLGAMGMTHAMPLERWYRELRIRRVGEGPSEVQRMLIARELLTSGRAGQ